MMRTTTAVGPQGRTTMGMRKTSEETGMATVTVVGQTAAVATVATMMMTMGRTTSPR
jgi:hypothetical protein